MPAGIEASQCGHRPSAAWVDIGERGDVWRACARTGSFLSDDQKRQPAAVELKPRDGGRPSSMSEYRSGTADSVTAVAPPLLGAGNADLIRDIVSPSPLDDPVEIAHSS
jgi:hypothetical protein